MSDYELEIGAYSPETIPMSRLAEYMTALADLLGEKDHVHFDNLETGSTVLGVTIQPEARQRTRVRLQEAQTADAESDTYKPWERLNNLLRDDNATGALKSHGAEVLKFPGCREIRPPVIGPFNKHTEIDGILVRIGGRDKTAHALIEDPEGNVQSCDVKRDLARQLAEHLFGAPIRLSGEGRWKRNEQEQWELVRFRVTDFKPLGNDTLADSIAAIRRLELELPKEELI